MTSQLDPVPGTDHLLNVTGAVAGTIGLPIPPTTPQLVQQSTEQELAPPRDHRTCRR
jgi:hypothetical protein